jgi:hypothetical protein
MGSTTQRCGVYGGEYTPPICVVEKERKKEASKTGQQLHENLVKPKLANGLGS